MRRIYAPFLSVVIWGALALPASADTLGQVQSFLVNASFDAAGAGSVSATLRAIGQHGYFYIDDRYWAGLTPAQRNSFSTNLNALSDQFDSNIYPRETAFFGSENNPGVDGDSHVVFMMEQLRTGSGGYFETIHSYSKDRSSRSNAHEMVFVNVESANNATGKTYVAHEFQHLISFNQKELLRKSEDDLWLNEGRSEYAITVSGYSDPYSGSALQRRVQQFVRTPSDSLVEWPNSSVDYNIASVFLHYLSDRYGQDIVASTTRSTAAGVAAVDEWLRNNGKSERFGDVFSDWMVASSLNDRTVDFRYGYGREGLRSMHVIPAVSARLDNARNRSDFSSSLKEWQPLWVSNDIGSTISVHVRVTGASDSVWRGAVVARYSNASSQVIPFQSAMGVADITVPGQFSGATIQNATVNVTQGTGEPVDDRSIISKPVTVTMSLTDIAGPVTSPPPGNPNGIPVNGDLIRRAGQPEIYVVWGIYRRNLPDGVLALYGFQNRTVTEVSDEIFNRYTTSNYVREVDQQRVYALWPDGTKHWMHITAAQWDASARDWGAIFTVNASEIGFYRTGEDITR